jgi:YD repeat-containing protein
LFSARTSESVVESTPTYPRVGQITSDVDTPANGSAQVQCFSYDYLGRLNVAWSQGAASCSSGPSQSAESGAAGQYWEQYTYNDENDLTSETSTPASGSATTITNAYADGPHQVTQQQAVTGSTTDTTSYSYDADGNTQGITLPDNDDETLNWNDADQLASVDGPGRGVPTTSASCSKKSKGCPVMPECARSVSLRPILLGPSFIPARTS